MNTRLWPVIASIFLVVGTGCAQPAPSAATLPAKAPGRYVEDLTVGTLKRKFILHVPKAYDATKRLPLVVLLHGWTSNATTMDAYSGFADKSEQEGFILATPEGMGTQQGWNVGWIDLTFGKKPDEIAFLNSVVDQVQKEVGVDDKRIYAVGHSNGAMLANLAGSRMGNRLAAIGCVAGTIGLPARDGTAEKLIPDPEVPISVILIHGKADPMVAYGSEVKSFLMGIGAVDTAKWWAKKIGASATPKQTTSQNGNVVIDLYSGGKNGTEVELVSITNGVHDWPGAKLRGGGDETVTGVKATDLIWEFLKAHPKK